MTTDALAPHPLNPGPDGLAEVFSITAARSFRGDLHEPDWSEFTITCHDAAAAERFAAVLYRRGCLSTVNGATVTLDLDRNQPSTATLPVQVAFIAASENFADAAVAEKALDDWMVDYFDACP